MKYLSMQVTIFIVTFSIALLSLLTGVVIGQLSSNILTSQIGTVKSVMQVSENMIYVADQPYNITQVIDIANLSEPGFIVIHRVDPNNLPGVIIAWSDYANKGKNKNIEIVMPIYDAPIPFDSLIAMLHKDNGDMIFKAKEDIPLTDKLGNPIWMIFNIVEPNDDISLWKTYRNEEYGYYFKFPSNIYQIRENKSELGLQSVFIRTDEKNAIEIITTKDEKG